MAPHLLLFLYVPPVLAVMTEKDPPPEAFAQFQVYITQVHISITALETSSRACCGGFVANLCGSGRPPGERGRCAAAPPVRWNPGIQNAARGGSARAPPLPGVAAWGALGRRPWPPPWRGGARPGRREGRDFGATVSKIKRCYANQEPSGFVADHGVEDGQQLAHAGDQGDLGGLTGRTVAYRGAYCGVAERGGHRPCTRRCVEGPSTPDAVVCHEVRRSRS